MTADWSREFEEPIIIPARGKRGRTRQLVTLKDAGEYITKLPKAEHPATEWQTAMEVLLLAVRGGGGMCSKAVSNSVIDELKMVARHLSNADGVAGEVVAVHIERLLAGHRINARRWMFGARTAGLVGDAIDGKFVGQIDRRMCLARPPKSSAFSDMLRI
jgi:hypothetical protein